jgi:hypothetical protein
VSRPASPGSTQLETATAEECFVEHLEPHGVEAEEGVGRWNPPRRSGQPDTAIGLAPWLSRVVHRDGGGGPGGDVLRVPGRRRRQPDQLKLPVPCEVAIPRRPRTTRLALHPAHTATQPRRLAAAWLRSAVGPRLGC